MYQPLETLITPNLDLVDKSPTIPNPYLQFVGRVVIGLTKEVIAGKSPIIFGQTPVCPLSIAYFKVNYEEFIKLNCPEDVFNKLTPEIKHEVFKALDVENLPLRELASVVSNIDPEQITLISEIMVLSNIRTSHFEVFNLINMFTENLKNGDDLIDVLFKSSTLSLPELKLLAECKGDITGAIESRLEKLKGEKSVYKVVTEILNISMHPRINNFVPNNQNPNIFSNDQRGYVNGFNNNPFTSESIF